MKYAMGSVFAPVIEYVTNLIYNLMRAVQNLVYAFSGVNIFAKATASSMKNASGSASKASKSLAGIHNEINNVSDNDSSGGSGSTSPSMDLSQMDNTPNSIIDAIKNGNWYEVGTIIGQKLNDAMSGIPWDKIKETAKKIGTGIAQTLNGFVKETNWYEVGKTISQGINTAVDFATLFIETTEWDELGNAIGTSIGSAIVNIDWKSIGRLIGECIISARELFTGIGEGIIDGIFEGIAEKMGKSTIWKFIKQLIVNPFVNGIKDGFGIHSPSTVMRDEVGVNIVLGIFEGITNAISGIRQWIKNNIFQPFIEGFKNIFGIHSPSIVMEEQGIFIMQGLLNGINSLVNSVTEIWNNMKDIVVKKFTNIKTSIKDVWTNVRETTIDVWNSIKDKVREGAQGAWNGITSIFGNIPDWFKNKFSKAWQAVKNVFSTGGKIFDGIKEGILSGLKSIVNAIITGINKVISIPFNGLNMALKSIRNAEIMGLRPFNWISTIQIPQIPRLAKGGVLTEATAVVAGEYSGAKSNPEIVTPQNIMRDTFEDALSDFNGNNGQPLHVTIQYLGKEIFDDTIDYINSKTRRTGKNTIVTVGN